MVEPPARLVAFGNRDPGERGVGGARVVAPGESSPTSVRPSGVVENVQLRASGCAVRAARAAGGADPFA
ncbi:hypothetical protein [Saccharothrix yanglingensis]|uniref:hypothetical protein n=1 Tax=Saccharothrix yanglingensis TaxID=659496 RepID=UPI0027D2BB80|nr:hypothetical protein [Saccharothrix yanglingensis]